MFLVKLALTDTNEANVLLSHKAIAAAAVAAAVAAAAVAAAAVTAPSRDLTKTSSKTKAAAEHTGLQVEEKRPIIKSKDI